MNEWHLVDSGQTDNLVNSVCDTYGLYDDCDSRGQGILELRGLDHAHGLLNLVMEAPHK